MRIHKFIKASCSVAVFYCAITASPAWPWAGGIPGYSGISGPTCSNCHSGGNYSATPSIQNNGDADITLDPNNVNIFVVATGSTGSFQVEAIDSNSAEVGVGLAATGGTLVDQSGTKGRIDTGNLVHDAPQTPANAFWNFDWTPPAGVGTYTFYWCNNLVNGDNNLTGDDPMCSTKTVKVNTAPVADNETFTPAEGSASNCLSVLVGDTSGTSGNETGDTVDLFSVTAPSQGGTATLGDGSPCTTSQIEYTPPNADFDGSETFNYTIRDIFNQPGFADTATVTINIAASNDAPTLTGVNTTNSYTENAVSGAVIDATITVNDIDNSFCNQATIDISTGYQNGQDELEYTGAIANVTAGAFNATTGTITLSAPDGTVTCANFADAMEAVRFRNTFDDPVAGSRTITFRVRDDGNVQSTGVFTNGVNSTTVSVIAQNDLPVISGVDNLAAFVENSGAVTIDSSISISDLDDTQLDQATISITANYAGAEDVLSYGGAVGAITELSNVGGVLTLTGTATLAQYQTALGTIQYNNTSDTPSEPQRTISMVVRDATGSSSVADTTTLSVTATNDSPVLSGVDGPTVYAETDPPAIIDGTITVTDPETGNCDQATVSITGNYVGTEDVLSYGGAVGAISVGSNAGGVLTLTGTATCADYATALEDVSYENTSLNPDTSIRTVEFQVRDEGSVLSNIDSTTITITADSTPPTVSNVDNIAAFTENGGSVVVDSAISISDPDSPNLNQATVTITTNFATGQDVLVYPATIAGITGAYVDNGVTGVLTLTLANPGTTQANFEQALESVRYNNTSENPSALTRTLSYAVRDTDNVSSAVVTTTLTVAAQNDAPGVSVDNSSSPAYTENGAAVIIDSTITVADVDTADQIVGATVSITGNFNSTEDELVYATTNGITGLYNSGTGVLTLSNTTTRADYEGALEAVRYSNNSENPNTSARTVSFVVTDNGAGSLSSTADTVSVAVVAQNDVPVIGGVDNVANYTEDGAAVSIDSSISISDVDNTQLNQATISISGNYAGAEDVLSYGGAVGAIIVSSNAGGVMVLTGTATLAQYQTALGDVHFQNTSDAPSTALRTISMVVRDTGGASSAADTTTLMVTPVNDDPDAVDDSGLGFNVPVNSSNNELDVLANDTDIDGDNLSIIVLGTPNNGGTVTIGDGGACALNTVCYTPPADFTGINAFTYTIEDDGTGTLEDTATVTVGGTDADGDGLIDFLDNCDNDPNPNQENNDGDSEGDICDTDDDNDGMTDAFEATHSAACDLDPFDAADAIEDCDGDGLNNVGEEDAGSDPTVDDVIPIFSGVQDITVDSTGHLTPVNLGNISAVDGADGAVVVNVDSVVNVTGDTSQDDALAGLFRPGTTVITRSATDSQGNTSVSVQTIQVRPLLNIQANQIVYEGGHWAYVFVYLNGAPLQYPASFDYTISGTSDSSDHNAVNDAVPITVGTVGGINIYLYDDGVTEGNETLVLTLSDPNPMYAVLGNKTVHTITITENNVPPAVELSVVQAGIEGALVNDGAGTVVVTASVADPGDTASFNWSGTPTPDLGTGTPISTTFEFDPAVETLGFHSVSVEVTDSAGASTTAEVFLSLIAAADVPVFVPGFDTDDDSINDDSALEGYADLDGDGIPNYLDAYEDIGQENLIQNQTGDLDGSGQLENVRLIETEPGFNIRKGTVAFYSNASGVMVSEDDVMDYASVNGVPVSSADDNMVNVGGIYDFEIYNMQPGATANVVLPLSARILEGSSYRKFNLQSGWRDFAAVGGNFIASASSTRGVCPGPGHSSYRNGLNAFDNCVQLTLVDGGPNDADGAANGVIRDPGGVAVVDPSPGPEPAPAPDDGSGGGGGGGVLHPLWLLLLGIWGLFRCRRRQVHFINL